MAVIRERGPHQFQAIVRKINRATGELHEESETFKTKSEAEEWAVGLEADLRRAIHRDTRLIDSTPLEKLINRYIEEVSPTKLGGDQEIVRLKKWLTHDIGKKMLSRATPKDFADFVRQRRKDKSRRGGMISEQTIKLELIAISNVFEVAKKDWGYDIENPTKQISKPKGSSVREVRIIPATWLKIKAELEKCRNKQYVIIAELAIETGMREDELFRMSWNDIDLTAKKVVVWGKDTSGTGQRKKRVVPLSIRAVQLLKGIKLRDLTGVKPVFQMERKTSADGLSRAFTAACEEIGLKGGCFHCTRHEAASRMAPHFPMLTLMSIFGWKTPAMAARYYHASDDDLHAGLEKMQRAARRSKKKS